MLKFALGLIVGSVLTTAFVGAGDYLNRSEAQQSFDYFRSRAQQLDVETIRRGLQEQQTEDQLRKTLGKSPC